MKRAWKEFGKKMLLMATVAGVSLAVGNDAYAIEEDAAPIVINDLDSFVTYVDFDYSGANYVSLYEGVSVTFAGLSWNDDAVDIEFAETFDPSDVTITGFQYANDMTADIISANFEDTNSDEVVKPEVQEDAYNKGNVIFLDSKITLKTSKYYGETLIEHVGVGFSYTDADDKTTTEFIQIKTVGTEVKVTELPGNLSYPYKDAVGIACATDASNYDKNIVIKSVYNTDTDTDAVDYSESFTYDSTHSKFVYSGGPVYPPVGTYTVTLGLEEESDWYTLSKDTTTLTITSRDYSLDIELIDDIQYGRTGTIGTIKIGNTSISDTDEITYSLKNVTAKDGTDCSKYFSVVKDTSSENDVLNLVETETIPAGTYSVTIGMTNATTGEAATIEKEVVIKPQVVDFTLTPADSDITGDGAIAYKYASTEGVVLDVEATKDSVELLGSGYTVALDRTSPDTAEDTTVFTVTENESDETQATIVTTDGNTGYAGSEYKYTATFLSADGNYTGTKDFTIEIIASDKQLVTYDLRDTEKYIQIDMSASVVDGAGKLQSFTTATNGIPDSIIPSFEYKTLNISTTIAQNGVTIIKNSLSGTFTGTYNVDWNINVQVDIDVNGDNIPEYSDPRAVLQLSVYKELKATQKENAEATFAYGSSDKIELDEVFDVTLAGSKIYNGTGQNYTIALADTTDNSYVNDSFEVKNVANESYIVLKDTATLNVGEYEIWIKITTIETGQFITIEVPVTITQGVYDGTKDDGLENGLDHINVSYRDCYQPVQMTTTDLMMNDEFVDDDSYTITLELNPYEKYDNEYFTVEDNMLTYTGTDTTHDYYLVSCLITSNDGNICSRATLQFGIMREWALTKHYSLEQPYKIESDNMTVPISEFMTLRYGDAEEPESAYGTASPYDYTSYPSYPSYGDDGEHGIIYCVDDESVVEGLTFSIDDAGLIFIEGTIPSEAIGRTLDMNIQNEYTVDGSENEEMNISLYIQFTPKQIYTNSTPTSFTYGDDIAIDVSPAREDGTSYDTSLELIGVIDNNGDDSTDIVDEFEMASNQITYTGDSGSLAVGTYTFVIALPESDVEAELVTNSFQVTVEPRTVSAADFIAFTDWSDDEMLDVENGALKDISTVGLIEQRTIYGAEDIGVSYANNRAIGTATVTLSGVSENATGSISYDYYVLPVVNADGSVVFDPVQIGVPYKLSSANRWKLESDQITYSAGITFYATTTDALNFQTVAE